MEPVPDSNFPHQTKFEDSGLLNTVLNKSSEEYHHPWDYPETPVEICPTFAGPWRIGDLPHLLLENNVPVNEGLIERYTAAPTSFETDTISVNEVTHENHMGDPVNFSSFLMWQLARPDIQKAVADWNLDADRGYAYKCWDWNRQSKELGSGSVLTDAEGHPYMAPCTPPPQTKVMAYDPNVPLKIHYLDEDDPGCSVDVPCVKRKGHRDRWPTGGDSSAESNKPRKGGRDS